MKPQHRSRPEAHMYQQVQLPPPSGIFQPGRYLIAYEDGVLLRISLSRAMRATDLADAIEQAGPDARSIAA